MILHLMLNSLFVFTLLFFITELLLRVFHIRNNRVRYLCYLLVLLKIPFDLIVFTFWDESFFANFNPLSCEIYVYELMSEFVSLPAIDSEQHLIIPQYIAKQFPSRWLDGLTALTLILASGGILWRFYQWFFVTKQVEKILQAASPVTRLISNFLLQKDMAKSNVKILQSSQVQIPFALHPNYIVMPNIDLTDDEFYAIVAHELQHVKWKDSLIRLIISFFRSICWWIPTHRWMYRIVKAQEESCDASMKKYNIENVSLVSAIKKIYDNQKSEAFSGNLLTTLIDSSKKMLLNRLRILLEEQSTSTSRYCVKESCVVFLCFVAFFSFWMC